MLSREVTDVLQAKGITPKQARGARVKLGVVVERSGSGRQMRSTWRLPPAAPAAPATPAPDVPAELPEQEDLPSTSRPDATPPDSDPAALTDGEQARIERRITVFVERGMGHDDAADLAVTLVLKRDRTGRPDAGSSCIECQNLARGTCPTQPRPIAEVHVCWFARHDAP